ncbi:MAG: AAA family ATPase [Cellvibrio sp. 79]|nr:MAG: AAA family ATPase [Cellvibrio sp. 79]
MTTHSPVLRAVAEIRFADELQKLRDNDTYKRPENWQLSPQAVRSFVIGDKKLGISKKFFGDDPLVERCIVTLMGHQGLMLVGDPGTAKSLLSELFAAAISGNSSLSVQGTAGTTEDHIRYAWNYALLLAEGPSARALVPSPVYRAMEQGKLVRFEEITRCAPEIQDVLISLMSDKHLVIPELGEAARLDAQRGFNIIATANLRDRGVHEMSSALKRRFNFETVKPIKDAAFEAQLIQQQVERNLTDCDLQVAIEPDLLHLLATCFQELRAGQSAEGTPLKTPDAVMSTAEAVNLTFAACLEACHFGDGKLSARELARQLQGVILKDNPDDIKRVTHYVETVVRERARNNKHWKQFHETARELWN